MKNPRIVISTALALAALILSAAILPAQTPPDKFLGFKVGADRKLADYNQIKAYFEKLAKESPQAQALHHRRIDAEEADDHGRDLTPKNLAKLDR